MTREIFYWVLNMSITASIAGIIVTLVRSIRKLPRRVSVWLWLIPQLRMILPFGMNSRYSIMRLMTKLSTRTVTVDLPLIFNRSPLKDFDLSYMNTVGAAKDYFPVVYKYDVFEDVFRIAFFVWITVFCVIFLTLTVLYFTTLFEMRDAVPWRDGVYLSDKVTSPAVYGIFRARIILPSSYADRPNAELECILTHERMHIRHLDNLRRITAFVITAAHWFNPLAWVFLKLYLADIELACDEHTLGALGEERKKEYATALLESGRNRDVFVSAFGGARVRTRIENILSFRKMSGISHAGMILLLAAIFYALLANAV